AFDKASTTGQALDLLAQIVGLFGDGTTVGHLALQRAEGELLPNKGRHDRREREGSTASRDGPEEASRRMLYAAAIAIQRQRQARVRPDQNSQPAGPDSILRQLCEQRVERRSGNEPKPYRYPPILPVDRRDAMDPVKLLCLERGLAVHLESKHLLELTLGRERQRYRLRQHVRLVDPEHARTPGRARQFHQARRPATDVTA